MPEFVEIPIRKGRDEQDDGGTRTRRVRRPVNVTFGNRGNPGFAQWSGSLSIGEIDFAERAIRRANNFLTNNSGSRIGSVSVTLNSVYALSSLTGINPDGYEVRNSRGIRIDGAILYHQVNTNQMVSQGMPILGNRLQILQSILEED